MPGAPLPIRTPVGLRVARRSHAVTLLTRRQDLTATIRTITLRWGRQWPASPAPNVAPPPGPVTVLRPRRYAVQVSGNGRSWRTIRTVSGRRGALDSLHVKPVRARFVRIRVIAANAWTLPMLQELTVAS